MARDASRGRVRRYLGSVVPFRRVAPDASRRRRDVRQRVRAAVLETVGRESVARHAIGRDSGTELRLRLSFGVFEPSLNGVARRAAQGRHLTDRIAGELMTSVARDVLFDDVLGVTAHAAVGLPREGDVDAQPGSATVHLLGLTTRARRDRCEHQSDHQGGDRKVVGFLH